MVSKNVAMLGWLKPIYQGIHLNTTMKRHVHDNFFQHLSYVNVLTISQFQHLLGICFIFNGYVQLLILILIFINKDHILFTAFLLPDISFLFSSVFLFPIQWLYPTFNYYLIFYFTLSDHLFPYPLCSQFTCTQ